MIGRAWPHSATLARVLRTTSYPAKLTGPMAVRSTRAQPLDRQDRLGPLCREVDLERVGVEGQQGIVAHQGSQLGQALRAELVQRGLKCRLTDLMRGEKFCAIVHHRGFIGGQRRQRPPVAQGIYQGVTLYLAAAV